MSSTTLVHERPATSAAGDFVADGLAMLGRHLQRIKAAPGVVILTQTMPITMLLFFGYVFGSALAVPGQEYRAFLVPGLLAATAAGGIMTGMFQSAQDCHRGVMDRFRALPMSHSPCRSARPPPTC